MTASDRDRTPGAPPPEAPSSDGPRSERPPLPRWKKVALVASALVAVLGFGWLAFAGGDDPGAATGPRSGAAPNQLTGESLDVGDGTATGATEPVPNPWARFFAQGGLSFFLAFAVGYALRTFLRMTLLVVGVVVLSILGLGQLGVVTIEWATAQDAWSRLGDHFEGQLASFRRFLAGSLPSAGMAVLGLVTGFKR